MKLIIDIPEDVYKKTIFYREFKNLNDYVTTIKALENGIPLEQIRAEIEQIVTYGQIDDNTSFIRDGGMVKKLVFEIIDRHMSGK